MPSSMSVAPAGSGTAEGVNVRLSRASTVGAVPSAISPTPKPIVYQPACGTSTDIRDQPVSAL